KKIHFGLLIFIFLYSIRMLYDLYINNIYTYSFPNEYTYLLYFYGLVLLPCVGIFFIEEIDYQKILKNSYIVLFIIILMSLILNFVSPSFVNDDVSLRAEGNATIGPLTFGHLGVTFIILSLIRFRTTKKNIFILGSILGIFVLILSGSRSPVLSLMVVLLILFSKKVGKIKTIVLLIILSVILYLFSDSILTYLSTIDNNLVYRIVDAIVQGNTSR